MSLTLLSKRTWAPAIAAVAGSSLLMACTLGQAPTKKKRTPVDCDVEDCYLEPPVEVEAPLTPDKVDPNSGAFGAPERPSLAGPGGRPLDAGAIEPGEAGAPRVSCGPALAAGDLAIVELMIASRSGSGDSGEWIEIQSTRDCWLKLKGVSVESPRGGAAPNVATITEDFELEPHGTFVVTASADLAKNQGIGGKVIVWGATDVLKNDGDTITVKIDALQIDSLAYPAFTNLTPGRALSFPSNCAWPDRKDWRRWSLTFGEFSPGLRGTPNAPNSDVTCF